MINVPESTVEQMQETDCIMADEFGISALQMMELAGHVTACAAIDLFNPREVLVLVGRGNNGGDGLVAARHLHGMGVRIRVVLAGEIHLDNPLMQLNSIDKLGIPVDNTITGKPDLIIDSLLGFGSRGEPRGAIALLIREANKLKTHMLSVDVPSGLEAFTGTWFRPAFEGATVLTLGLPKKGMTGDPKIGRLLVGDIGIPPEAYKRVGLRVPVLFRKSSYIEVE